jgi:hypothetical protein
VHATGAGGFDRFPTPQLGSVAENPHMRVATRPRRSAALVVLLTLSTALPAVEWCPLSRSGAAACDSGRGLAKPAGMSAATCPSVAASCAISCDRGPTPLRIAERGVQATAATGSSCPLPCETAATTADDRAWCVRPPADGVTTRSLQIAIPIAPPWLATLTDPAVIERSLQALAQGALRRTSAPPSTAARAPAQPRAPPIWVGDVL